MIGCLETRVNAYKANRVTKKLDKYWSFHTEYRNAPNGRIWVGGKTSNVAITILYSASQLIHC